MSRSGLQGCWNPMRSFVFLLLAVICSFTYATENTATSLDAILARLNALESENLKLKESLNVQGYKFDLPSDNEKIQEVSN